MERKDGALVLNDTNWAPWMFQIMIVLRSKGWYDALLKKPSSTEDACTSVCQMWKNLNTIYEAKSEVGVQLIQQKFYSMEFEEPMAAFISKVEEFVNQLRNNEEDRSEKMVVTKIVMSLPDKYRHFISVWESVPEIKRI